MFNELDGMRGWECERNWKGCGVGNVLGPGWDAWLGICKEMDGMHGWECVRSWMECIGWEFVRRWMGCMVGNV
jgi:hypothetical protein